MDGQLIIAVVLQAAGVLVVFAEIFLPSGGILSIIAVGLFGWSLYLCFAEVSTQAGLVLLAVDAVLLPALVILSLKLLARSPATLRAELSSEGGYSSQSPELAGYVGKEGTALSDLRPSGVARIEGRRVDVVTRGEYVEKDAAVIVLTVSGNRVVVKAASSG